MDTNPIFDYLYELETHRGYKNPSSPTLSGKKVLPWKDYTHFLRRMNRQFEACVFKCVSENPEFKKELHIIADRLRSLISIPNELERLSLASDGDISGIVSVRAAESLEYLQKYGVNNEVATSSSAPHFKGLNISEEQASKLYDKLVPSRLEDTGKSDFIYYFTGKGKQPSNKLIWKGDAIFLSNIMSILSPNRIPWKQMDTIFEGLNTDSMKSNLTKSKDSTAFKSDKRMIEAWLKTDSASIIKSMSAL